MAFGHCAFQAQTQEQSTQLERTNTRKLLSRRSQDSERTTKFGIWNKLLNPERVLIQLHVDLVRKGNQETTQLFQEVHRPGAQANRSSACGQGRQIAILAFGLLGRRPKGRASSLPHHSACAPALPAATSRLPFVRRRTGLAHLYFWPVRARAAVGEAACARKREGEKRKNKHNDGWRQRKRGSRGSRG